MAQKRLTKGMSRELKFKNIVLLKDNRSSLGVGAYGSVVKAQCDDLVCAAKIIHPTLVHVGTQTHSLQYEQRLPLRRFETECEFLKDLRHPHIIQYLGMYQDPDTGLPVLLMELADENLTQTLENKSDTITYAFQLNISFDVACALSFLHSNSIVHRDLSSNNVLIFAKTRAKLSDFGMAKFVSASNSQISNTIMPGTDVYMPPEALDNAKAFTDKGDIFSLGVNMIQILTRKFPSPGDRFKTLHIDHPQVPEGKVQVRVPERERREAEIISIDPFHPLLPTALDCIKDSVDNRPTASELCRKLTALKREQGWIKRESLWGEVQHKDAHNTLKVEKTEEGGKEALRHDPQLARETADKKAELSSLKQQRKQILVPEKQHEEDVSSSKKHEKAPKTQLAPPPLPPRILRRTSPDSGVPTTLKPSRPPQYHVPKPFSSKCPAREPTVTRPKVPPRNGLGEPNTAIGERKSVPSHATRPPKAGNHSPTSPKPRRKLPSPTMSLPLLSPSLTPNDNLQLEPNVAYGIHQPVGERKSAPLPSTITPTDRNAGTPQAANPCCLASPKSPKPHRKLPPPAAVDAVVLEWRRGKSTPIVMSRDTDAVVNGSNVYLRPHRTRKIYSYNSTAGLWSRQIDCLADNSTLAIVEGFLTTVGGTSSNKLHTLSQTESQKTWLEKYPSMSAERARCTALSGDSTLIVAGGLTTTGTGLQALKSIEVLNIDQKQWSIAADLPQPIYASSGQVIDDCLYFLGGFDKSFSETRAVYSCSLTDLLMSCHSSALRAKISALSRSQSTMWRTIPNIPATSATCINFGGKLIAIGGRNEHDTATNQVCMYDSAKNAWCKVERELINARAMCFAVVLHNDTAIMVVGGVATPSRLGNVAIDSVEFGQDDTHIY